MSLFPICSCPVHHKPAALCSCSCDIRWTIKLVQFLIIPCSSISCTGQYILRKTFLPELHSRSWCNCINVRVLLIYSSTCLTCVLYVLTLYWIKYTVHNCYVLFTHSLLPVSCNMYVVFPSFPFNPTASSAAVDAISVFFLSSDLPVMSIIWLHLLVRKKCINFRLTLPLFRPMFPNQVSVEHL